MSPNVTSQDEVTTEVFARPVLGISACLNGEEVRYDGASRRFKQRKALEEFVDFQPYCPEVAIGLGVPRKTLRLVGDIDAPNIVEGSGDQDVTDRLQNYADAVADGLENNDQVTGFVVCKGSPSCGMDAVKRYSEKGDVLGHDARGIFTAQLMRRLPTLPVEEDGRLNDKGLMENFLTRIHVVARWKKMVAHGLTAASLLQFHREHKFLLLAHNQEAYRDLGKMLADLSKGQEQTLAKDYFEQVMNALQKVPTLGQHTNVLMHLQGYVKDNLTADERSELSQVILDYNNRQLPRQSALILLKHHLLRYPNEYAQSQHYLEPFPKKMLQLVQR